MKQCTFFLLIGILNLAAQAPAQEVPSDYQKVFKTLDKSGDYKSDVLKVNIPRNDLQVSVAGIATPTPFGFGGWVALTKGRGGEDVMMGDLVLLQEEALHAVFEVPVPFATNANF